MRSWSSAELAAVLGLTGVFEMPRPAIDVIIPDVQEERSSSAGRPGHVELS